jgi:hypothetical protein
LSNHLLFHRRKTIYPTIRALPNELNHAPKEGGKTKCSKRDLLLSEAEPEEEGKSIMFLSFS